MPRFRSPSSERTAAAGSHIRVETGTLSPRFRNGWMSPPAYISRNRLPHTFLQGPALLPMLNRPRTDRTWGSAAPPLPWKWQSPAAAGLRRRDSGSRLLSHVLSPGRAHMPLSAWCSQPLPMSARRTDRLHLSYRRAFPAGRPPLYCLSQRRHLRYRVHFQREGSVFLLLSGSY